MWRIEGVRRDPKRKLFRVLRHRVASTGHKLPLIFLPMRKQHVSYSYRFILMQALKLLRLGCCVTAVHLHFWHVIGMVRSPVHHSGVP